MGFGCRAVRSRRDAARRSAPPACRRSRCTRNERCPLKALPHPLSPDVRPLTLRDLVWLTGSLAIVIAPHVLRAPWWLTLLTLCLYGWRIYCALTRAPLPSRWLLLGIAAAAMMAVWFESRTLFGRTPGILLLVLFSGLKLMEARNHRDAA